MGLFCVIFVPPYLGSTLQLEAFRLRGGFDVNARAFGSASVHAVFADIRVDHATAGTSYLPRGGLFDFAERTTAQPRAAKN
jgi:hypothetical protein